MSYWAALCRRCSAKTESREFCAKGHLVTRDCEWCGGEFTDECTRLEGERPKPDVCIDRQQAERALAEVREAIAAVNNGEAGDDTVIRYEGVRAYETKRSP